ncbi:MAG: carboxylating nicotinate-nucleotide diphosphorylase [Eubacterium sp.]|nr:carboxylating nicotinate-nucleotide diphosphorylase [Eubacterium sp.]
MKINVDSYLINTLKEDITSEDVSTNAVMPENKQGSAQLICKQDGIICGLDVFERAFFLLDENSRFETEYKDGDEVKKGTLIGTVYGEIKALLSAERTGLNYLQRMSGIATMTREYADELKGYKTVLLDTRKTTPNMRPFEKHAVKVGGGTNHRYNLSDGVLLKDNHIGAAGSITKAIEMAKAYAPFVRKIEIETETLEQVKEALEAGADIIMLDNMDNETMRKAVELVGKRAQTECSGNVTKERLREIGEIGLDFVSCGALTHSAPILDFSLKNLKPLED